MPCVFWPHKDLFAIVRFSQCVPNQLANGPIANVLVDTDLAPSLLHNGLQVSKSSLAARVHVSLASASFRICHTRWPRDIYINSRIFASCLVSFALKGLAPRSCAEDLSKARLSKCVSQLVRPTAITKMMLTLIPHTSYAWLMVLKHRWNFWGNVLMVQLHDLEHPCLSSLMNPSTR